MSEVSWSELYARRREVNARYPSVFRLPTVRRALRLAKPWLRPRARILEVGGGAARRGERLAAEVEGAELVSVDTDPAGGHDHTSVEETDGQFDLAVALELIEHLPLDDALRLLTDIRTRLTPGGVLLLSTPNVFCPGRYLRDATHVTPFAYDELGGALLHTGYDIQGLYRVIPGTVAARIGKAILSPLGRALGIDHAPSIAALASAR